MSALVPVPYEPSPPFLARVAKDRPAALKYVDGSRPLMVVQDAHRAVILLPGVQIAEEDKLAFDRSALCENGVCLVLDGNPDEPVRV